MSHRYGLLIATLAFSAFLAGCRSTPVEQSAPVVSRLGGEGTQTALLETGRSIYTGQCARCHRPKPVQDYAAEEWTGRILPKMAKKAKLSAEQNDAVLAYILAARNAVPESSPPR